jgi:L-rhamnose-H+ transport protein
MDILTGGILTTVAGGILNGTFILPMKAVKKWRWENMWLGFGLFGLLLLPLLTAAATVPHLLSVYSAVSGLTLLSAAGLGVCWGVGSLLFGLGISALGLSLGYAIIMGTTAIFGTLIPAIALDPYIFNTNRGWQLLASLALILAGLVFCALAGMKRDKLGSSHQMLTGTGFGKGLTISLLAGILSACFNIGFALTADISRTAEQLGASKSMSAFAVWVLIMGAGFLPSLVYCLYLARRNRSFSLYRFAHRNWLIVFLMGLLWVLSVALYGIGATNIGPQGASIGWPILMSSTILTANGVGIWSGEWRGIGTAVVTRYLYVGLALLLAAVILAGLGGVH